MEKMEIPFEMADEKKGGWMGFLLGFLAHFFLRIQRIWDIFV